MPNKTPSTPTLFHLRIIGLFLIITQVTTNLIYHNITNMLWLCNISTLLAGVALLLEMPQVALTGATYMIFGLIFWFINVLVNHTFGNAISYITHFSFALAAVYLFFRIPVGRYLWIGCFCWYLFTQLLSRLFTPAAENINIAFGVWPGWEGVFSNFFAFWCFTTFSCLVFLFVVNRVMFRLQRKRGFE